MKTCLICKEPMTKADDCGGDCIYCMAECDDPDALRVLLRRVTDKLQECGDPTDPLVARIRKVLT